MAETAQMIIDRIGKIEYLLNDMVHFMNGLKELGKTHQEALIVLYKHLGLDKVAQEPETGEVKETIVKPDGTVEECTKVVT